MAFFHAARKSLTRFPSRWNTQRKLKLDAEQQKAIFEAF
jgi:hypothetical protein